MLRRRKAPLLLRLMAALIGPAIGLVMLLSVIDYAREQSNSVPAPTPAACHEGGADFGSDACAP